MARLTTASHAHYRLDGPTTSRHDGPPLTFHAHYRLDGPNASQSHNRLADPMASPPHYRLDSPSASRPRNRLAGPSTSHPHYRLDGPNAARAHYRLAGPRTSHPQYWLDGPNAPPRHYRLDGPIVSRSHRYDSLARIAAPIGSMARLFRSRGIGSMAPCYPSTTDSMFRRLPGSMAQLQHPIHTTGSMARMLPSPARWPHDFPAALPARWPECFPTTLPARWPE